MQQTQNDQTTTSLPRISIIVAMTDQRIIGDQQGLPWHLPEDLQLFKSKTLGTTVIMGRKTYQSIGRSLPGRCNIVLSRKVKTLKGVKVCSSFIEGLTEAARHNQPVFVIGGAEIYRKALPIAADLHVSWVKKSVQGDISFPAFDLKDWQIISINDYSEFKHIHYRRINA